MIITDLKGTVQLNNGVFMPYFGLGVFKAKDGKEVVDAVAHAINTGYRLIDTASLYGNERGVGEAVRASDVPRKSLFVTSKVWNTDQGYEATLNAFDNTMTRLSLDYLDLYLIHWPVKNKYKQTWKALEKLFSEGHVRSIGVSNFLQHHLEDIMTTSDIPPSVNQIEFHPRLVQPSLLDFCENNHIQVQAWSPLMQGGIFAINVLKRIAEKHEKTVAQVVLRWNLQKGVCTIPKTTNPGRMEENADIFDFFLPKDDMTAIDSLDQHHRVGADPDHFSF